MRAAVVRAVQAASHHICTPSANHGESVDRLSTDTYAFRHAMGYLGLTEVSGTLVSTETTLPLNYRCAPNILVHAVQLISQNKLRAPKRIEAFRTLHPVFRWRSVPTITARR